jgi:hypothetical protein
MRSYNFWRLMFNKVISRSYFKVTSLSSHTFFGRKMDSSK